MAQSIKLGNDTYWDTSGLYGGRLLQSLGELSPDSSMTITIPSTTQGAILVTQNNASHGLYSFNTNSSGATRVCTISAVNAFTVAASTNIITISNTGTLAANVNVLATKRLSTT